MRLTSLRLLGPIFLACVGLACGDVERVTAQAESERPFSLPGVEGDVCLARVKVSSYSRPRIDRRKRIISHHNQTALAAEGTSVVANQKRYSLGKNRETERALLRSTGWESIDFGYEWRASDDARTPPPEVLVLMARQSNYALLDGLLEAFCDGNGDCIGGRHDIYDLTELDWSIDIIRCGESFEFAAETFES